MYFCQGMAFLIPTVLSVVAWWQTRKNKADITDHETRLCDVEKTK